MILLLGEIAALGTAICWSFSSIFFTIASRRLGALQVNLIRLPLALFVLGILFVVSNGSLQADRYSLIMLAISGVIGLAIGDTFLFYSMVLIGARLSMLLLSLAPPMTALLAFIFLGEKMSAWGIIGIIITLSGVSWVVAERSPHQENKNAGLNRWGILFGVLAAAGQAGGLIFSKAGLVQGIDSILATIVRMSSATLILWPFSLLFRKVKNPVRIFVHDLTALKYVLLGVVFGPSMGMWLSLVSVKYTYTGVAATIMSLVPVIMIPLSIWLEKEKVSWRAVLGAIVAVLGVAILFLR